MYKTLIVDDREIFLIELKRLKVWGNTTGFEIVGKANNGEQALCLLRKNSYDLVITDIRMPIIDGLQLLHEIKNEKLCSCVVLLSEHSEFQYARQGIVFGAFDYLVKPPGETELLSLLKRVKCHLDSLQDEKNLMTSTFEPEQDNWSYPIAEEKMLIHYFKIKDITLIPLFQKTIEQLYKGMFDNLIKADLMIKKLYHTTITAVYNEFPWLYNYIHIHYFEEIDYIHDGDLDTFKDFYIRKITYLIQFLLEHQPIIQDNILNEIISYILLHPETDLKLKVMGAHFYINSTHLSNTFFSKTGIHYNDYITMVKMSRAKYLFQYTDLKIYEISYQLGYKDNNYFSKQFKKIYGLNPTTFRNTPFSDYQI